jgi:hypothetical protein
VPGSVADRSDPTEAELFVRYHVKAAMR